MQRLRTQVGIVGAGPAGLLLSHLLHLAGIESVVVEARDRAHIEGRIRAGVLEHGTVACLRDAGLGARMQREGLEHEGIVLKFGGTGHRIDFRDLTGAAVTVYGQHEVVKDLVAARLTAGGPLLFEAEGVALADLDGERARISCRTGEGDLEIACDFVAGCDGFHGVCRAAVPPERLNVFERVYPFGWLGILADAPPAAHELVYAAHARGFALLSMRSPTLSRLYIQCAPDEDLNDWPDDRIWEELGTRLDGDGLVIVSGPIVQKSVTAMRSFVAEPMRFGRLFLAGDAAHIVPPTGAKGMNLAVADVRVLARAIETFYAGGGEDLLDAYSATCLRRIWKVQRFSWWMTQMLHRFDDESPFDERRRFAELAYVASSRAAATSLAENYVGLPMEWD